MLLAAHVVYTETRSMWRVVGCTLRDLKLGSFSKLKQVAEVGSLVVSFRPMPRKAMTEGISFPSAETHCVRHAGRGQSVQ